MIVNVKYFGMIAEKLGMAEEQFDLDVQVNFNLRSFFESKYPEISQFNYKIAVNQQLTEEIVDTNGEAEIALLPPFAGG